MSDGREFKQAIEMLVAKAPSGWEQIEAHYLYCDGAMKVNVFHKNSQSSDWLSLNYSDFDLMDFFEEYREKSCKDMGKEWMTLKLTINSRLEVNAEYGYEVPNIFETKVL